MGPLLVLVRWCIVVLVYWRVGILLWWRIVVLVYCRVGVLLYWCIVVLVYCCVGVLSCLCIIVFVCCRLGILSCWCIVMLVCWCGARLGGSKSNAVDLILRLFLYYFLHTMSSWRHKSICNNKNNQQTPPPWWWSRSPLQRHGFNESTLSEWWAALLMFVSRPLLKGFGRINKLM